LAEEGLSGILAKGSDKIGGYGDILSEFDLQELKHLDYEGRAIITQHEVQARRLTHGLFILSLIIFYHVP